MTLKNLVIPKFTCSAYDPVLSSPYKASFFKELNYWVKFEDWKHTRTNSAAALWCQTEVRKGDKTVFVKFTSATSQNIQLCETRIPYSKLVRLRSRKRLHQQLVPHMLHGQNNKKKSVSETLYKNLLSSSSV